MQLIRNIGRRFYSSHISKLWDRGLVQDVFPDNAQSHIRQLLSNDSQAVYAGFDPTAESLHVGNLLVMMGLMHFQRTGHQAIALLGGATGLIGDPSGRSTERNLLETETMERNLKNIKRQMERIFGNHKEYFYPQTEIKCGPWKDVKVVNNADWYNDMNLIEFISTIGRHFRLGQMMSRTSVQSRLTSDTGMSFVEFTYQIFQGYDWLHLLRHHNCCFQLGGSDQMGNLMTGHELISRVDDVKKKRVFGITLPIITNEEGDKYGKSSGNAIWLDAARTTPFSFYQFFLRTPDAEVEKLLKFFTFLDLQTIKQIMDKHKNTPELREAQRTLAQQVTTLIHGRDELRRAEQISDALYGGNVQALGDLSYDEVKMLLKGTTSCEILLAAGMSILDLAMKAKCFPTIADAGRIIKAGGFYVNQCRTTNIEEVLVPGVHILKNGLTLLRVGKKNYYIVRWLQ